MSATANQQAGVARQRKILLVEDEVLVRMDIASELRVRGFEVLEAGNSAAAKRVLGQTAVDLVLTDLNMPGPINGLGLARWVLDTFDDTKIAVISGRKLDDTETDLVDAHFLKGTDMDVLMNRIRALLR